MGISPTKRHMTHLMTKGSSDNDQRVSSGLSSGRYLLTRWLSTHTSALLPWSCAE